ncbi:MAG: type 1 glutamine amidotransferase [Phycisphaeraceae bacterium]|nr:type 1 glutamine amidotransferase [Phycisphaeraceae bacterium]
MRRAADTRQSPLIGITTDLIDRNGRDTCIATIAYAHAIRRAGATPVMLAPDHTLVEAYARSLDGLVLTGGDDPCMEPFGAKTHPKATPLHPARQRFESDLIRAIRDTNPGLPVLGVCLGMQMLALLAGGTMDQHLPDSRADASRHWEGTHEIIPIDPSELPPWATLSRGTVLSRHKQAVTDPGSMRVIATSDDGLIEAIADPNRPFMLGVQWHPERTESDPLGHDLFRRLVDAARA